MTEAIVGTPVPYWVEDLPHGPTLPATTVERDLFALNAGETGLYDKSSGQWVQLSDLSVDKYVDTVADLSSLDVADGAVVQTKGYYTAGDGGGRTVYKDTSSSATVDGVIVFSGQFLAIEAPSSINTLMSGLRTGTDSTHAASNDTQLAAYRALTTYIRWVGPGRYYLSSQVVTTTPETWEGDSLQSPDIYWTSAVTGVCISTNAKFNARNFRMFGDGKAGTQIGLEFFKDGNTAPTVSGTRGKVENCELREFNTGIRVQWSWTHLFDNVHVQDCQRGYDFEQEFAQAMTFIGGTASNCDYGVYMAGKVMSTTFQGMTIEGNAIAGCYAAETYTGHDGGTYNTLVRATNWKGCFFENPAAQNDIDLRGQVRACSITGNNFASVVGYSVEIGNSTFGAVANVIGQNWHTTGFGGYHLGPVANRNKITPSLNGAAQAPAILDEGLNNEVTPYYSTNTANVQEYGALADGTTASDAGFSAAALKAGADGSVYIPEGTYSITGTIANVANGQRWYGPGKITTPAAANWNVFDLDTLSGVVIDGLRCSSPTGSNGHAFVRFGSATSCRVTSCETDGMYQGIVDSGIRNEAISNRFINNTNIGVFMSGAKEALISGNTVDTAAGSGIDIRTSSQCRIVGGNVVTGCTRGIDLNGGNTACLVSGNTTTGNTTDGIRVVTSNNCSVATNMLDTEIAGVRITSGTGNLLAHNQFNACTTDYVDTGTGTKVDQL